MNEEVHVNEERICAHCGRRVWADDRYCPSCGVAFAGAPAPVERSAALPGFTYHLIQGLGWGLGFALAGAVVWLVAIVLIGLTLSRIR